MKAPIPLEHQIHLGVAKLLREHARQGVVWFHIPNERKCSARQGAFLKKMGVLAGIADFGIIRPIVSSNSDKWHAGIAFLELKTEKGRLSMEQKKFRDAVEALGCVHAVARSTDEAAAFLKLWGVLRSHRPAANA